MGADVRPHVNSNTTQTKAVRTLLLWDQAKQAESAGMKGHGDWELLTDSFIPPLLTHYFFFNKYFLHVFAPRSPSTEGKEKGKQEASQSW